MIGGVTPGVVSAALRGGAPPPPPFDPFVLPNASASAVHFWDCDTGVTMGTGVAAIADQVGSAPMSQGQTSRQPTLISNWRNGRNAIQGTSGMCLVAAITTQTQPCTFIFVGTWGAINNRSFAQGGGDAANPLWRAGSGGVAAGNAGSSTTWHSDTSTWGDFVATVVLNGASSSLMIKLVGQAPVTYTGNPGSTGFADTLHWLTNNGMAAFWGSPMAGIGYYSGAMDSTDQGYLVTGFGERYAI